MMFPRTFPSILLLLLAPRVALGLAARTCAPKSRLSTTPSSLSQDTSPTGDGSQPSPTTEQSTSSSPVQAPIGESQPSPSATASSGFVRSGWYPGWANSRTLDPFPISQIPWGQYDVMTWAFAETTSNVSNISLPDPGLQDFVAAAQSHNVAALLSIGGWSGSQYFSTAVATAENRAAFVNAITLLVTNYSLDGIDFDWEYPGGNGLACNIDSTSDTDNFLKLLQELRQDPVGMNLTLTATAVHPFLGTDGNPMSDVSAFANVLDRVAIMAYDVYGKWSSSVGPNAPLDDACASTHAEGSVTSFINEWSNANFPLSKIALGVPSYGHSFRVAPSDALQSNGTIALYPNFELSKQPLGNTDLPDDNSTDPCGQPNGVSGIFTFEGLITNGFLNSDGTAATGNGISHTYDECSQTPVVYNSSSQVMVSYDDVESFAAKATFIKEKQLAGFAVWDVTGDSTDNLLLKSLNNAIGA